MIDGEWITSLENGGFEEKSTFTRTKNEIIESFVDYYSSFSASDDEDYC